MSAKLAGGCLCGEVRYICTAEPQFSLICCCRQCQQITGTGHAPQFAVPAGSVTVSGPTRSFDMKADNGNTVTSTFCAKCGSPIFKASSGHTAFKFFHAATLDDPSRYKPQQVVWARSKQPWDYVDPSLPVQS